MIFTRTVVLVILFSSSNVFRHAQSTDEISPEFIREKYKEWTTLIDNVTNSARKLGDNCSATLEQAFAYHSLKKVQTEQKGVGLVSYLFPRLDLLYQNFFDEISDMRDKGIEVCEWDRVLKQDKDDKHAYKTTVWCYNNACRTCGAILDLDSDIKVDGDKLKYICMSPGDHSRDDPQSLESFPTNFQTECAVKRFLIEGLSDNSCGNKDNGQILTFEEALEWLKPEINVTLNEGDDCDASFAMQVGLKYLRSLREDEKDDKQMKQTIEVSHKDFYKKRLSGLTKADKSRVFCGDGLVCGWEATCASCSKSKDIFAHVQNALSKEICNPEEPVETTTPMKNEAGGHERSLGVWLNVYCFVQLLVLTEIKYCH